MAGWNPQANNVMAGQQAGGNSMVVFINDDSAALNYLIAPGYTIAFVNANDPNDGKLFIRSAESNGMPKPTRVFALKEITPKSQDPDMVSRKEFEELNSQFASMSGQFASMNGQLQQILSALQQQLSQVPSAQPKGGAKK